jgi:hypothetical protein
VLQLRLPLATRPAGRLVPHQICQHRHFPNLNQKLNKKMKIQSVVSWRRENGASS